MYPLEKIYGDWCIHLIPFCSSLFLFFMYVFKLAFFVLKKGIYSSITVLTFRSSCITCSMFVFFSSFLKWPMVAHFFCITYFLNTTLNIAPLLLTLLVLFSPIVSHLPHLLHMMTSWADMNILLLFDRPVSSVPLPVLLCSVYLSTSVRKLSVCGCMMIVRHE
ncbi:hypothetical protein [Phaffia rhodozyma]|uniref:Uncharacterized protein n=1 Tax=Phaffia rhodozyma TaxID=264483 RepID=A0A0F7SW06_PHARH|nr:hypothetical protein [Phaffia rhodozyma]